MFRAVKKEKKPLKNLRICCIIKERFVKKNQ